MITYPETEQAGSSSAQGVRASRTPVLPFTTQDTENSPLSRTHDKTSKASVFSSVRLHAGDATERLPDFEITKVDADALLEKSQKTLQTHVRRHFDLQLLRQFYTARDVAMRTMKNEDFDKAIDAMLRLYAGPDADIPALRKKLEESWENGGVLSGLRSVKGRAINQIFPVMMPYLINYWSGKAGGLAASSVNFAGTLAAGIVAMERDADFLLHITPAKDLQFTHGAPNIAEAMKDMTLSGVGTTQDAAKKLDELMEVPAYKPEYLQGLYKAAAENPDNPALREEAETAYRTAETALRNGMLDYQCASLFGKVWDSGGLRNQCWLQAVRMYGNMAATWSAYTSHQPISGWFVTGTTAVQTAAQPFLARGDQVREQYGQMRLNIAKATPEKGEEFLQTAWRTYEQIGQQQFLGILKEQSAEHLPKAAAKLLDVTKRTWREYRALDLRHEMATRWNTLDAKYQIAVEAKGRNPVILELGQQIFEARDDLDAATERQLCDQLADEIGMNRDECWEHNKLSAWDALREPVIGTDDETRYLELDRVIRPKVNALSDGKRQKYDTVFHQYRDTVLDQLHIQELKFTDISSNSGHRQAAAALMDPERQDSFRNSPAFLMGFLLDGDRRSHDFAEYGAAVIAGVVRTYQAIIANPGGAVLVGSLLSLITEAIKNKNPHYHETAAARSIGTDIMAALHLLNIAAVSMIAVASGVRLGVHLMQSSAGEVAERVTQNFKLMTRDILRARGSNDFMYMATRSLRNLALLIETGIISVKTPDTLSKLNRVLKKLDALVEQERLVSPEQSLEAFEEALPVLQQVNEEMEPGEGDNFDEQTQAGTTSAPKDKHPA
ncbi:hypothetical protein [Herbaspirillum sp. RV1423]|uniref:hypothetical protein n=1 Tax=Herbaspirillum sp. RV1423 TaxID=1443993 RepID=UPI0012DF21E6|nr:hypothetical protein [Herbaspirillum sp. RV1423]